MEADARRAVKVQGYEPGLRGTAGPPLTRPACSRHSNLQTGIACTEGASIVDQRADLTCVRYLRRGLPPARRRMSSTAICERA